MQSKWTVSSLDLTVNDAIVLNDSNRLVVRLTPCDIVEPRVEPRVLAHDGFKITIWAYLEPVHPAMPPPAEYTRALRRLRAGLQQLAVTTPHVMDRIAATQRDVASRDVTPELADEDRALLANTLRDLSQAIILRRRFDRQAADRDSCDARSPLPVRRARL